MKRAKPLTALAVSKLKKPGPYFVGGDGADGLFLNIKDSGARSWLLRVMVRGKRQHLGLGGYPVVPLDEAREEARRIRKFIKGGGDPLADKQKLRDEVRVGLAKRVTWDEAVEQFLAGKLTEFRNEKHQAQWRSTLKEYTSPLLGALPVDEIDNGLAVQVLQPIWATKTVTATRVRQRAAKVIDWATVSGLRSGANPFQWTGNLEHVLAKPSRLHKVKHHAALPWQEIGAFMASLRERGGLGARALEFAILTAARTSEVLDAPWSEIDLEKKLWTIPAARMKAQKLHRVPLTDAAVRLLKSLPRAKRSAYVFAGDDGEPLSDMTMSKLIKDMHAADVAAGGDGYLDPHSKRIATPHGTARSCFKDWARSSTAYANEVSELALAHVDSDETRAAYARDELLPLRTKLMAEWSRYCATLRKKADVVPIRSRRAKKV